MNPPTFAEKEEIANRFLSDEAASYPERYETYFRYYEMLLTGSPDDFVAYPAESGHLSHGEKVSFFEKLISNASQNKREFGFLLAANSAARSWDSAIRQLLQVSLMIDCEPWRKFSSHKAGDYVPREWMGGQSFADFVERCFPSSAQNQKVREESQSALAQRDRLHAWDLEEWYKISLHTTDDLAKHLVFEPEDRVLHVFRHVGFLKAHLYRSRDHSIDSSFKESLERGTLPPQLLLEALDSIQYLLFPENARSFRSLDKFVKGWGFDPQAKEYNGRLRSLPEGEELEYKYFGDRVARLMRVVDKGPPPRGIIAWLERYPSERNALTIAVLGLFLTALLGFLSLIVGTVALVYSILQYKVAVKALQTSPMPSST